MLILLFLIVSGAYGTAGDTVGDINDVKDMVRSVIHQLCPGVSVCLNNQTSFGNQETDIEAGEKTCCTECSCEPTCESKGNCCFQTDVMRQDINNSEWACLFPVLPQPHGHHRIYYQSYRMITDLPEYNNKGNKTNTTKCGDTKVAPWGAFFPVFSRKTKTIYKNAACASASNVSDGIEWDAFLSCKHNVPTFRTADAASFISGLFLDKLPDHCQMQFAYPGDNSDLTSEMCFEDLISSCDEPDFQIPNGFPWQRNEITKACASGLISPYRKNDMYANVFCHICNVGHFKVPEMCENVNQNRGPENGFGLVTLLDGSFMSYVDQAPKKQLNVPQACPIGLEDEGVNLCRNVYCPSGQIQDDLGMCVFAIKKWHMRTCSVNIKLKADKLFSVDETFDKSALFAKRDSLPLRHKWPNNWFISRLSYEVGDENENMTKSLLVEMINNFPARDPKVLLKNIEKNLKLPWSLNLQNKTFITMSADWIHIPDMFHVDPSNRIRAFVGANYTFPLVQYAYLYEVFPIVRGTPLPITKLYFCEQVELEISEYEWKTSNLALINKITNKTYLPGEFTTIFSEGKFSQEDNIPIRICLHDSGFIKRKDKLSSAASIVTVSTFRAFSCLIITIILSCLDD